MLKGVWGLAVERCPGMWLFVSMAFGGLLVSSTSARVATVGSNLGAGGQRVSVRRVRATIEAIAPLGPITPNST